MFYDATIDTLSKASGLDYGTVHRVDLNTLETLARTLKIDPRQLLMPDDEGV